MGNPREAATSGSTLYMVPPALAGPMTDATRELMQLARIDAGTIRRTDERVQIGTRDTPVFRAAVALLVEHPMVPALADPYTLYCAALAKTGVPPHAGGDTMSTTITKRDPAPARGADTPATITPFGNLDGELRYTLQVDRGFPEPRRSSVRIGRWVTFDRDLDGSWTAVVSCLEDANANGLYDGSAPAGTVRTTDPGAIAFIEHLIQLLADPGAAPYRTGLSLEASQ